MIACGVRRREAVRIGHSGRGLQQMLWLRVGCLATAEQDVMVNDTRDTSDMLLFV